MKRFLATPLAISLLLASLTHAIAQDETAEANRTVIVNMVDFGFDPAEITVLPGDTVRFVQTTATPHNVEFRRFPDGARFSNGPPSDSPASTAASFPPPRMGPFLTQPGEVYEIVIGRDFVAGVYRYMCTPHEVMDMKGKILVVDVGAPGSDTGR